MKLLKISQLLSYSLPPVVRKLFDLDISTQEKIQISGEIYTGAHHHTAPVIILVFSYYLMIVNLSPPLLVLIIIILRPLSRTQITDNNVSSR